MKTELRRRLHDPVPEMGQWLRTLEQRIESCEARITRKFKHDERCQRLAEVPGVGQLTATALVAAVGQRAGVQERTRVERISGLGSSPAFFGRQDLAARITKRGDRYLRTLLIHGARSALRQCKLKEDARSHWVTRIKAARGPNVAAVAMANKNARILWALLSRGDRYRPSRVLTRAVLRPASPPPVERARGVKLRVAKD